MKFGVIYFLLIVGKSFINFNENSAIIQEDLTSTNETVASFTISPPSKLISPPANSPSTFSTINPPQTTNASDVMLVFKCSLICTEVELDSIVAIDVINLLFLLIIVFGCRVHLHMRNWRKRHND